MEVIHTKVKPQVLGRKSGEIINLIESPGFYFHKISFIIIIIIIIFILNWNFL
jgi:hypothetical protein